MKLVLWYTISVVSRISLTRLEGETLLLTRRGRFQYFMEKNLGSWNTRTLTSWRRRHSRCNSFAYKYQTFHWLVFLKFILIAYLTNYCTFHLILNRFILFSVYSPKSSEIGRYLFHILIFIPTSIIFFSRHHFASH